MSTPALTPHDAAMADKVDALDAAIKGAPAGTTPEAPEQPAATPPEGQPPAAENPPEVPPGDPAKAPEAPPEGDPPKPAEAGGKVDLASLEREFAEQGALSEASYKALDDLGFPKNVVDTYVAGQVALAAARDAEGFALAGGKEQYQAMGQWAATALPAAEVEAFDAAVTSGDPLQMKQAILALKAQYVEAVGSAPQLNNGVPSGLAGEAAFASRAEVTAAMRDPRYGRDPAYRAMVERRIGLMDTF